MDSLPINITDIAIAAILLLSGMLALARGLVKEVLSIVSWVGAAILALEFYPLLSPYFLRYIEQPLIADVGAFALIFLIVLVTLSLVSSAISRRIQRSEVGALDRSLGFLFGLLRGVVIVAMIYIALVQFIPPREHPAWLQEARATPVIQYSAGILLKLTPEHIRSGLETAENWGRDVGQSVDDALKAKEQLDKVNRAISPGTGPDIDDKSGYTSAQRRQIERLIGNSAEK